MASFGVSSGLLQGMAGQWFDLWIQSGQKAKENEKGGEWAIQDSNL